MVLVRVIEFIWLVLGEFGLQGVVRVRVRWGVMLMMHYFIVFMPFFVVSLITINWG